MHLLRRVVMKAIMTVLSLMIISTSAYALKIKHQVEGDRGLYCVFLDREGNVLDVRPISLEEVKVCLDKGGVVMDNVKLQEIDADASSKMAAQMYTLDDGGGAQYCKKKGQNLTYISCQSGCTNSAENCTRSGGEIVNQ